MSPLPEPTLPLLGRKAHSNIQAVRFPQALLFAWRSLIVFRNVILLQEILICYELSGSNAVIVLPFIVIPLFVRRRRRVRKEHNRQTDEVRYLSNLASCYKLVSKFSTCSRAFGCMRFRLLLPWERPVFKLLWSYAFAWQSSCISEFMNIQCILDYPAMLGNLFPKSWPDKKSIYRRVPTVHHLHRT